jgi:hypothetical protein
MGWLASVVGTYFVYSVPTPAFNEKEDLLYKYASPMKYNNILYIYNYDIPKRLG